MKSAVNINTLKKIAFLALFFIANANYAQCAMCRATLESEGNQDMAMGVNHGIQYLMVFPYLIWV